MLVPNNEDLSILEKISNERKAGIKNGDIPEWMVTPGYQLFKEKYQWKGQTVKETYWRIAKAAAKHMKADTSRDWAQAFFDIIWNGYFGPSTPVMANMGTGRGCPVSCSGGVVDDSIYGFYNTQVETAMLTKNGFGTSADLSSIRPRGTPITGGGYASGVVPVFKDYVQLSRDVSQGNTRRGAWAGYLDIEHGDLFELVNHIIAEPDDANVGWIVRDSFIKRLNDGDADALLRFQRVMKLKALTGKGYFVFIDKINRQRPPMYIENGLEVKASNLCLHADTEITVQGQKSGVIRTTMEHFNNVLYSSNDIEQWKVLSNNINNGSKEFKNITDSALMKRNAKLMKITDETTGKFIKCTPEHKVYTKNRGYVMAKDLKEDDELVIS